MHIAVAFALLIAGLSAPVVAAGFSPDLPDKMKAPPSRVKTPAASETPAQPDANGSEETALDLPDTKPPHPTPAPQHIVVPATPPNSASKPSPPDLACRRELTKLGVKFREADPKSDPIGCEVDHPVIVTSLGKAIKIAPEALLNCATAETLASFAQNVVEPAAEKNFHAGLKNIRQVSAYVCRPRMGTSKLSEHAFGNAIDIRSFEFDNGESLDVKAYAPPAIAERAFLKKVRKSACGPFKTVLGPGTNSDHATHFHLDLAERHNQSTYCH